jgi:hypothetical protein
VSEAAVATMHNRRAALRAFVRTGRIEDAARLIGSPSLDTTAALLGYPW